jgi:hypothetical protein
MSLKQQSAALLFSLSSLMAYAGGEPVNEDLTQLYKLSQDMITLSKQSDAEGFMNLVNLALKLTAENRNNSIALPRVSAKLRAAKKSVKAGNFSEAIGALEQA